MATLLLLVARKGARFNFLYVSHSLCSCTGSVEAFAELGLDAKRAESDATGQMGIPAYGPKGTSAKRSVLEGQAMLQSRREAEQLEKKVNALVKRNRRVLSGAVGGGRLGLGVRLVDLEEGERMRG